MRERERERERERARNMGVAVRVRSYEAIAGKPWRRRRLRRSAAARPWGAGRGRSLSHVQFSVAGPALRPRP